MKYILTYSKHEQAAYLLFSRGVFRALSSISDKAFVKTVNNFQCELFSQKASSWIFDKVLNNQPRCSVRKSVLRYFTKFRGKHLCQRLYFNKLQAWNLRAVNFAKFLRIPFLKNASGRLGLPPLSNS